MGISHQATATRAQSIHAPPGSPRPSHPQQHPHRPAMTHQRPVPRHTGLHLRRTQRRGLRSTWMDKSPTTMAVQLWTAKDTSLPIPLARHLYLATPSQGADSTHSLNFDDAFGTTAAPYTQFITGPDSSTRLRRSPAIRAEVVSTTSHAQVLLHPILSLPQSPFSPSFIQLTSDLPPQPHLLIQHPVLELCL